MRQDFGKKLDELKGTGVFMVRVAIPAAVILVFLLQYMYSTGFAGFPLVNKAILIGLLAGVAVLLSVCLVQAARHRLEICQRGIILHNSRGVYNISYSDIERFEWAEEVNSIGLRTQHCHIVEKGSGKRLASISSNDFANMGNKMLKLEHKLNLHNSR